MIDPAPSKGAIDPGIPAAARGEELDARSGSEPLAQLSCAAPKHARLGELLIQAGLITEAQLEEALLRQTTWGSRIGDIILASGWVKPRDFYQVLARHFQIGFVNLLEEPPDESLLDADKYQDYARHLYLPWRLEDGSLCIATADPTSPELEAIADGDSRVSFVVTSKFDILWELQRVAGRSFSRDAVQYLSKFDPGRSASVVLTSEQKRSGILLLLLLGVTFWFSPVAAGITLNAAINLFLLLSFFFRAALCWMSYTDQTGLQVSEEEVAALRDSDLPLYSILVPLYKEPEVLPLLATALRHLDYPPSKLDIKLVLEENDHATIQAAKDLGLDATFEILRVPDSRPQTKPKACNYALRLARGKYVVIYDAEDRPEPDQLKKAVVAFRKLGESTVCIQARLNYFNSSENWLTRMFTLEYSLWFDMFLPAMDRLRLPIPLGGTSNHFDAEKLREVGAWDPFNVTEDADLGMRFAALGYRVRVMNSVTYEEANSRLGNWIRQRSRWIKGYMQTWLVNMRDPIPFVRSVGLGGFCSFHLFVGGTILSSLAYPFLIIPFAAWLLTRTGAMQEFFPPPVLLISTVNLVIGSTCLIILSMLAAAKRRYYALIPHAILVPGYWFLQSVAGYKGLWQLVTRPFYWEKTTHGITRWTGSEVAPVEVVPQRDVAVEEEDLRQAA